MLQCHMIKVRVHGGETLSFSEHTSASEILQTCASNLKISDHYFRRFTLRSTETVFLPYRSDFRDASDKDTLFFELLSNIPVTEALNNDFATFTTLFNQAKHAFILGDLSGKECEGFNLDIINKKIFLIFCKSNGLSVKRSDLGKLVRKYNSICQSNISEEKVSVSEIVNLENDGNSIIHLMRSVIEQYQSLFKNRSRWFSKFALLKVLFDTKPHSVGEVILNKLSLEFVSLGQSEEIKLGDIKQISSTKPLVVSLILLDGSNCEITLPSVGSYETFLAVLDYNMRSLNMDTASAITSVCDIPVELGGRDTNFPFLQVEPLCVLDNVSARELKLTLEIHGLCSGSYGIIQRHESQCINLGCNFYVLIYAIENRIFEKIICWNVVTRPASAVQGNDRFCAPPEEQYFLEDTPDNVYTSLTALIQLSKFKISPSGKLHPLSTPVTKEIINEIQDPEISKIFIPQSLLDVSGCAVDQTWLATIYLKGKLSKGDEQRTITYFAYKDWAISPELRNQFLAEASTLTKVQHENVLQLFGVSTFFSSRELRYIAEDATFYTLHEHLKTDYIPTYSRFDLLNCNVSVNSSEEGDMAFSLLFKYVRYIVAGLQFLHKNNIVHTLPAPQHILIDHNSNNLKLFDVGIFGKVFNSAADPEHIIHQSERDEVSILRLISPDSMLDHRLTNSTCHDRWVFGCTVWQIFNKGSIPLAEYSNQQLIDRYLEMKEEQGPATLSGIPHPGTLRWFPLKLEIPKHETMKLNKMLQKLVNYIITNHMDDQENAFEEIAELYNQYIFPDNQNIDIYERVDKEVDINISRQADGRLLFEKQRLFTPSAPLSRFTNDLSGYDQAAQVEEKKSNINMFSNFSNYSGVDGYSQGYSGYSDFPEDCDNMEPCPDSDYDHWDFRPAGGINPNYDNNYCLSDEKEENSFAFDKERTLLGQLDEFNAKKWESSDYVLGEEIGRGNFGMVCKAEVQPARSIPPDLHNKMVAVKTLSLNSDLADLDTIFKEAKCMLKLQHPRIVPLYGVSVSADLKELHIIMPFYPLKCLKMYISNYRHQLKSDRLIQFGQQIAEGMEYLSSQGFVHRDLALRNILVDNKTNVRIADLGLTRGVDRDADYYYLLNNSRKAGLPTLYYPPEFFSGFKYDKWCDVWSYGVTMFEMWSFGEVPYKAQGIQISTELVEFLKHSTLDIPDNTPPVFQHIMKKCWLPKRERWDFKDIVNHIKTNVIYCNPEDRIKRVPEPAGDLEDSILTKVLLPDGTFSIETIDVLHLTPVPKCELPDIEGSYAESEIRVMPYDAATIRKYRWSEVRAPQGYISEGADTFNISQLLSLNHRNIMQLIGYEEKGGYLYTASPVHSKGTLYTFCSNTRNDNFSRKTAYGRQVLEGMLYLLSQNIVHGSLSVHNVWLRTTKCAVIGDVGMVRGLSLEQLTPETIIRCPPEVMLEVLAGRIAVVDHVTDTWMFGIMLLQMFAVHPPFQDVRPELPESDPDFTRQFGIGISTFLSSYSPAGTAGSLWPCLTKNALNVCFVKTKRGRLSSLKSLFSLQ